MRILGKICTKLPNIDTISSTHRVGYKSFNLTYKKMGLELIKSRVHQIDTLHVHPDLTLFCYPRRVITNFVGTQI